jgi:hypothetical protein
MKFYMSMQQMAKIHFNSEDKANLMDMDILLIILSYMEKKEQKKQYNL